MANRKRNIQMKFYVTEEEKWLIDEKMAQLPTRRYGAYLRKMAIDGYIIQLDTTDTKEMNAALTAYQTEHFFIFGTGAEYPAYSSQQKVFQHFFHIIAFISTKKVVQAGADAGCPVPDKSIQHILYGMVAVLVCHNGKRRCDLFSLVSS